jgi:hypothetical protein
MQEFKYLRAAVIGQWLALIVSIGIAVFEEKWLPSELQSYLQKSESPPSSSKEVLFVVLGIVSFAGYIISSIGIWRKSRWAPRVYLYSNVLGGLSLLLSGPVVLGPWSYLFGDINVFLIGITVGLIYYSPVKELFQ